MSRLQAFLASPATAAFIGLVAFVIAALTATSHTSWSRSSSIVWLLVAVGWFGLALKRRINS